MNLQEVVLVTPEDAPLGVMDKMEAHHKGLLHRAFSIFIFDEKGRMLLQQRAAQKYHSAGLWTNACCSHPGWNEPVEEAARRRLLEELGFTTPLKKLFAFTYKADMENGLTEHEYDHVFTGTYSGPVPFNPEEVQAVAWKSLSDIRAELQQEPERFTAWFRIAFSRVADHPVLPGGGPQV